MKRYSTIGFIPMVVFAILACFNMAAQPIAGNGMDSVKPNILFIFSDDQRYNTIHALGGNEVLTPNLDALVASGTSFTHAYNMGAWHGAVCVASRTMLLTGLSVWKAQRMEKKLAELVATNGLWSQQMRQAGYETYMSGKWHVGTDVNAVFDHVVHERAGMPNQTPQGYNRPLSPQDTAWQAWDHSFEGFWKGGKHWSEVLAEDAVNFLNQAAKKEKPFFMYLAFNAPHDPRQSPKEFVDKYPLDKITVPANYLDQYPWKEEMGAGVELRDEQLAPFPRTKYAAKKQIQEYYASISHMDEQIGKIISALAASGKLDNTHIIFTSDHGLSVGHHGLMGKQNMFDHSIRVPFIVAGPGIPRGEKRDQDIYLQDIVPTTYQLAGIQKPGHVYFNSLLPIIKDKDTKTFYPEIYGGYMNVQRMVRTDRYKLIVYPSATKLLLFDLKEDPDEINDVASLASYRPVLEDMKARLIRQQQALEDTLDLSKLLQLHASPAIDRMPSDQFIYRYGSLNNFLSRLRNRNKSTVAFLGGSITAGNGWRDHVMEYLKNKYPTTTFTFINAGIPSLGSLPHAFRLKNDVLSNGSIDLLFIESAVNDLANGTPVLYQRRALEGIVRHALKFNPAMDIVMMAFADETKIRDYDRGKIPAEVQVHNDVATYYRIPFINLAEEVTKRIDAKEFTWEADFKDLHPSPFGHELYFNTIKRLMEILSTELARSRRRPAKVPPPMEKFNYAHGEYIPVTQADGLKGFAIDPAWKPADSIKTRKGFVNVPMLVSEQAGSSFEFSFEGDAVGISLISGPDAGIIQYSIDDGEEKSVDLFTQWSRSLHLPWYLMLSDGLRSGKHSLKVKITTAHNERSIGTSCRIVHFLVNK